MFLPTTTNAMYKLGWDEADVIIVSGDAYIDSPYSGAAVVGKALLSAGFRVAVIAQPDIHSDRDIMRLGSPRLYWGVTAGATDSLVANYTASGKKRKSCDFTPGGINNRRPDRASIVYANLIKRFDKKKRPLVLGGIEASLRRFSHYDLLQEGIRRSIIFDAKADYLVFGMGEYPSIALAKALCEGEDGKSLDGVMYISSQPPENALILPSFEETKESTACFYQFFHTFYEHSSSLSRRILAQKTGSRYAVQNPPYIMSSAELDHVHNLEYEREVDPYSRSQGKVAALEMARHSIPAHRGCFGECNFCAITIHQGRRVNSRSESSILKEAAQIAKRSDFTGIISDLGGPTANMYGAECPAMLKGRPCAGKSCLYPTPCSQLNGSHKKYLDLLASVRKIDGVKKIIISSGIRCDMAVADTLYGTQFIKELAVHHTGGQIKLAPEHSDNAVLALMRKPALRSFERFIDIFCQASRTAGKNQFVTCYFMAAHPGCDRQNMLNLKQYISSTLSFTPEQTQIFTPTPSTWSSYMYHSGKDFQTSRPIFVARSIKDKVEQKNVITKKRFGKQKS